MDKGGFLKVAAIWLLIAILFTPQKSNIWLYFFIPGLILGILWFRGLE